MEIKSTPKFRITRSAQEACISLLAGGSSVYAMTVEASNPHWVWPIPQEELHSNTNFGDQNSGYAQNN